MLCSKKNTQSPYSNPPGPDLDDCSLGRREGGNMWKPFLREVQGGLDPEVVFLFGGKIRRQGTKVLGRFWGVMSYTLYIYMYTL